MSGGGHFVVRVYLDGEVLFGVDEFHQHGKLVTGVFVHVLAYELAFIFFGELCNGFSCEGTFGHYAFVVGHSGKLPAFGAPDQGFKDWFELKRMHNFSFDAAKLLIFLHSVTLYIQIAALTCVSAAIFLTISVVLI